MGPLRPEPSAPAVPLAELRSRVERVAEVVRDRGLRALLVWSRGGGTLERHGEVLWLSGFYNPWLGVADSGHWTGQSWCAVLVTAAAETVLITNIPRSEWAHQPVQADTWTDDPFIDRSAVEALARHGLLAADVGLAGRGALSVDIWERLRAAAPGVRWVDADGIVTELGEVKSPSEIALMRDGGRVADAQLEAILAAMQAEGSELAAVAAGAHACVRAGGVPYGTFLADGPRESRLSPGSPPGVVDRRLGGRAIWRIDVIGSFRGYLYDFARSTVLARPDALQEEVLEAPIAVVQAVIGALAPGRPVADAFLIGARTLERVAPWRAAPGRHDFPHLGHTLGPGWGGWWITEDEHRPVREGMVFAVEAAIAHPTAGTAIFEQNVVVGAHGAELLTRAPVRPWA